MNTGRDDNLAKVRVDGSNPFARSNCTNKHRHMQYTPHLGALKLCSLMAQFFRSKSNDVRFAF